MSLVGGAPSIWDSRVLDPSAALLTGKVALITGAAQGIGEATALAMACFGADVAVCDRKAEGLAATHAAVEDIGRQCLSEVMDVRDEPATVAFVQRVVEHYGRIDVLVNNAGGGFWSAFLDVSPKGELALMRENFGSVTNFIRHCVPHMPEGSAIVNITSVEAHRAGPGFAVYSAMKAGVANLAKSLALELSPRRIRINNVAPDVIPTEGDGALGEAANVFGVEGLASQPWPEIGAANDVAAAALFLASDMARFVTGTTVHVDGGTWAAAGWKARTDGQGFTL